MYQDDYLTRTIKQFAEMLAALLFGARARGEPPSFSELDELSWSFTGLGLSTLLALEAKQLLQLFSGGGELDVNKAYVSAQLLYQMAQEAVPEETKQLYQKALLLLDAVSLHLNGYLNEEHEQLARTLRDTLTASP